MPPIETSITVYRGIKTSLMGDITSIVTHISTSYDQKESLVFTNKYCCMIRITLSPGSKVLPVEDISIHPLEKEIIVSRFGSFNLVLISVIDDLKFYDLVYLPEGYIHIESNVELNSNKNSLTVEQSINRLNSLIDEEELELYDTFEDYINDLITRYQLLIPHEILFDIINSR